MKETITKLPEWQKGWLAGILDGEGCIGFLRVKGNRPYARIKISMTCELTIKTINQITKLGHVTTWQEKRENSKLRWDLFITDQQSVYVFLKNVLPYILTKRKHATLMLNYIERRMLDMPLGKYDEQIVNNISKLNRIGRNDD